MIYSLGIYRLLGFSASFFQVLVFNFVNAAAAALVAVLLFHHRHQLISTAFDNRTEIYRFSREAKFFVCSSGSRARACVSEERFFFFLNFISKAPHALGTAE